MRNATETPKCLEASSCSLPSSPFLEPSSKRRRWVSHGLGPKPEGKDRLNQEIPCIKNGRIRHCCHDPRPQVLCNLPVLHEGGWQGTSQGYNRPEMHIALENRSPPGLQFAFEC